MTSFSFWYPFWHFVQPGVLWSWLAAYSPMLIFSALVLLVYIGKTRAYPLQDAFKHPAFIWAFSFLVIRCLTLIGSGFSEILEEATDVLPIHLFIILSIFLIRSPRDFSRFVWGAMLGGGFLVLFGIYAHHAGFAEGGLAGTYGNYENHNDYTFIVLQTLPYFYLARKNVTGFLKKFLLSVVIFACFYGIFLSQSRGGMLALVLQVVLIVLFTMPRKTKLVVLPIVALIAVLAISIQYQRRAETNGGNYTESDAKNSRFELWKAGVNMFIHNPILGVGSHRFYEYARHYGELSRDQLGKNSHNTYIEIASSMGLLGTIGFIGLLLSARRELRKQLPESATARLDWIRVATLIAFYTILFRATLDAKDSDWSWFLFVIVAVSCGVHRRKIEREGPLSTAAGLPKGNSVYV